MLDEWWLWQQVLGVSRRCFPVGFAYKEGAGVRLVAHASSFKCGPALTRYRPTRPTFRGYLLLLLFLGSTSISQSCSI